LAAWKDNLAYFSTGEDPVLQREMTWHAYNLLSASVYVDFYKAHIVPQGSAYLYLHGADGAPRDQALFALPGTYLSPALARDMLRLIMQVTDGQTGQISYAFAGYGFLSDGLGIHTKPSDLDLFFLLALSEYLSATADFDFLNEKVPFYPPEMSPADTTVLDHVRVALQHLFEVNGIGEHGLIKVGSGDWSDGIVLESSLRDGPGPFGVTYNNSKQNGESIPNTQLALYVLPLLAAILKDRAPQLVDYIYDAPHQPDRLARLQTAVQKQWNARGWYNRAVLRDVRNQPVVIDRFDLEAQPWALISGAAAQDGKADELIEKLDELLDRPSPIGGTLVAGGMVWPAISQLLTWAYARTDRGQLAWRSLNRNTFAMHCNTYPNIWFNTWSGPDGINGLTAELPGGTWSSPITPMTDFPVMNANQDAMALLGLLRVCGVEPSPAGDGLVIHPRVPRETFILEMALIRLEVAPKRIVVQYRAVASGSRKLYIHHSMGAVIVKIDNVAVSIAEQTDDQVVVPIQFEKGQVVRVEVTAE
jgi:cellobiose phosphorylase